MITDGNFDSQNLAFWDPQRKCYLDFHRKSRLGVRDIMTATSTDFVNWSQPVFLEYGNAPREHLYTNAIRPYFRAPHLLLGFPTRFQPQHEQVEPILMSSRDGQDFHRWSEPLIPITAPDERDGNRSNYMTWGLLAAAGAGPRVVGVRHGALLRGARQPGAPLHVSHRRLRVAACRGRRGSGSDVARCYLRGGSSR